MDSVGEFFLRWHPEVCDFLRRKGAPQDRIEDMASESIVRFLEKGYPLVHATILFGIARHILADYWRELEKEKELERTMRATFDETADPAAEMPEDHEEAQIVGEAIRRLPTGERSVVQMRALAGMGWERICMSLEISLEAARSRYKRGLEKLRDDLGRRMPAGD